MDFSISPLHPAAPCAGCGLDVTAGPMILDDDRPMCPDCLVARGDDVLDLADRARETLAENLAIWRGRILGPLLDRLPAGTYHPRTEEPVDRAAFLEGLLAYLRDEVEAVERIATRGGIDDGRSGHPSRG